MALNPPLSKRFRQPLKWLTTGLPVMDRYIIGELLMPFIFGVVAFSSIGVAIGVLFDLVRRITEAGLPITLAIEIFFLKLPYFLSLSFPMSLLLACLIVYGRLSSDSELIALRSCGVSVYRLVLPALIAGLVMTGVTFVFNEVVVPVANRQASITLEVALKGKENAFREEDIVYQDFRREQMPDGTRPKRLARIFYAKEFDGTQMKGLTILDFSQPNFRQIILAQKAVWNEEQSTWDFYDGIIYAINPDGSYRNILRFERQQLRLPRAPLDLATSTTDPIEMSMADIQQYMETVGDSGKERTVRKLQLRYQQKISFPFACLLFAFLGSTLGIRPPRASRRMTGFGISLVLIVSYYLFTSICEALYFFGLLNDVVAAWLPAVTGFVGGWFLLVRQNR